LPIETKAEAKKAKEISDDEIMPEVDDTHARI
jgi:hypothetical protein